MGNERAQEDDRGRGRNKGEGSVEQVIGLVDDEALRQRNSKYWVCDEVVADVKGK